MKEAMSPIVYRISYGHNGCEMTLSSWWRTRVYEAVLTDFVITFRRQWWLVSGKGLHRVRKWPKMEQVISAHPNEGFIMLVSSSFFINALKFGFAQRPSSDFLSFCPISSASRLQQKSTVNKCHLLANFFLFLGEACHCLWNWQVAWSDRFHQTNISSFLGHKSLSSIIYINISRDTLDVIIIYTYE